MALVKVPKTTDVVDHLGLRDCRTKSIDDSNVPIWIYAEQLPPRELHCPACGNAAASHGTYPQNYIDRPSAGKPVVVALERRRARCKNPGCETKTFQVPHDEFRGEITSRCRRYIEELCFKRTFASLAAETGVPEGTVRRIADQLLLKLDGEFRIDTPRVLAIDDICLPSGKDWRIRPEDRRHFPERRTMAFRTVFSNAQTSQVVEVAEDRRLSTVLRYLLNLQGSYRVRFVTIDMSQTYRDAVWLAFGEKVTIVADRWHVTARANAVVDKIRLGLTGRAKKAGRHFRLALLVREEELLARRPERHRELREFLDSAPRLKRAYEAKEAFLAIYDRSNANSARSAFAKWRDELLPDTAKDFARLIAMCETWSEEIFAYWSAGYLARKFDREKFIDLFQDRAPNDPLRPLIERLSYRSWWVGLSNGKAEARNQVIRLLNRVGRSYSFRFLRARAIYSTYDVHKHFGVCAECRLPFKRNGSSRRRSRERRTSAFHNQRALQERYALASTCENCDAASTGVTRSGAKPHDYSATHCGLADIWTDAEPCLADDGAALIEVQGRYQKLKRRKNFKKDLRAEMEPFIADLF